MLRVRNCYRGLLPKHPERLPEGQSFLVRAPHPYPRGKGRIVVTRGGSPIKHPRDLADGKVLHSLPSSNPSRKEPDRLIVRLFSSRDMELFRKRLSV